MVWISLILQSAFVVVFIRIWARLKRELQRAHEEIAKLQPADINPTSTPGRPPIHSTEPVANIPSSVYNHVTASDDETRHRMEEIDRGIVIDGTTDLNVCAAWDEEDSRLWRAEQAQLNRSNRILDDLARNRGVR